MQVSCTFSPCVWAGGRGPGPGTSVGSLSGRHAGGWRGRWPSCMTSPLWSAAGWCLANGADGQRLLLLAFGGLRPTPVYLASAQDPGLPGDVCFESEGNLILNLWGDRIPHLLRLPG